MVTREPDSLEETAVTLRPVRLVTPSTRYCQRRVNRVQRTPRWKGLPMSRSVIVAFFETNAKPLQVGNHGINFQ